MWECSYTVRVLDDVAAVLYDSRRQSCHSLVLSAWVAVGGLEDLIDLFNRESNTLWAEADKEAVRNSNLGQQAPPATSPAGPGQQSSFDFVGTPPIAGEVT